jgi:hypothetical protein
MCRLRRDKVPAGLCRLILRLGPVGLAIALTGCAGSVERGAQFQPVDLLGRVGTQADFPNAQVISTGRSRMSPAEQDAVIAQAITAHEMRRP